MMPAFTRLRARLFAPLPLLGALLIASPASAVVLDFESLAQDGDGAVSVAGPYEEAGFRLTSSIDPVLSDLAFSSWQRQSDGFNGSTALFNTYGGQITTLRTIGGDTFTPVSMVVGPIVDQLSGSVTFIGRLSDNSEVSSTFAFGPALTPASEVAFDGRFSQIVSLSWEQETVLSMQFDKINVVPGIPIPEPATGVIVGAGLLVLALATARRRRRMHLMQ